MTPWYLILPGFESGSFTNLRAIGKGQTTAGPTTKRRVERAIRRRDRTLAGKSGTIDGVARTGRRVPRISETTHAHDNPNGTDPKYSEALSAD